MPEMTFKWELTGRGLRGTPGHCMMPSTAPRDPGLLDIFNQAVTSLPERLQIPLLVMIRCQSQPWLKGPVWAKWLARMGQDSAGYRRLFKEALTALGQACERRGIW
jgi:hypothetical protein